MKKGKRKVAWQAVRAATVHTGMRSVERSQILVDQAWMPADGIDGFPHGKIYRQKVLHAPTDEEGVLVLQVQASQCGEDRGGVQLRMRKM